MTGSPARQLLIAATAVLLLILAVPVGAQKAPRPLLVQRPDPPVKLVPLPAPGEAPAPGQDQAAPGESGANVDQNPFAQPGSVEIKSLGKVDPDSVGVIDESQGGFGVGMWEGTQRTLVGRLLPLLPARIASPTMRDLMRRLLLTRAMAPAGQAVEANAKSLLALRVRQLFRMGNLAAARQLLQSAPSQLVEESLTRTEVESLFFGNDNAGACKQVRSHVQEFQGPYWQQAIAFCLALAGQHAKAALVADILAEREGAADASFFTAMEALAGPSDTMVETLSNPMALRFSMMRAANLKLPADIGASPRPTVMRAVALSPNADLDVRLKAADSAAVVGALSVSELREIYASVGFGKDDQDNPLTAAEANWGPRGRALLVRAAARQDVPTARAEVLQRAWQLGREKGGFDLMRRVSLSELLAIEPAGELMWFAGDAARALYAAGRAEEAAAWYQLVAGEAESNEAAATAAAGLWPLAVIADGADAVAWDPAALGKWWQARRKTAGEAAVDQANLLFSLLTALGKQVPLSLWAEVIGDARPAPAPMPNPALRHALETSSAGGRIGETVVLVLLVLGEAGPAGAGSFALERAIVALGRVGLNDVARSLALEAAIANGI